MQIISKDNFDREGPGHDERIVAKGIKSERVGAMTNLPAVIPVEHWFRVAEFHPWKDAWQAISSNVGYAEVALYRFPVGRHTRCGVWIDVKAEKLKWVSNDARKRYASPTIEEAKEAFIARKKRQIGILEAKIDSIKECLGIVDRIDGTRGIQLFDWGW